MIAFTRDPSASRASTIGLDSSMRRPTELTMRSMICSRWRSSLNVIVGRLEPAVPLDVDLVESVDQDVRDRRIGEQHLERTETEQLVQHVADDALALVEAERRRVPFPVEHPADERADLGFRVLALDPRQAIEVEPVEQILVDAALQLLIRRVPGVRSADRGSIAGRGSMTADSELTSQFLFGSAFCLTGVRRGVP